MVNFSFKNLNEGILKEFNRKKLKELNRAECLVTRKATLQREIEPSQNELNFLKCQKCKMTDHSIQTCKFKSFQKHNMIFVTEYILECYDSTNFPP